MKFIYCIFSIVILLLSNHGAFSQSDTASFSQQHKTPLSGSDTRKCVQDIRLFNLRKNASFRIREDAMNEAIMMASRALPGDTLTLPVVIHIINQDPLSISDQDVIDGVQDLNDAFSKLGNYSTSVGVDTKLRFCLSQKDPDGGNTTGITRTTSFLGDDLNMDNEDAKLKNLIQWDPNRYINIWLVTNIHGEAYADYICGTWYRLGVGGYASLPPGGGATDGIVISGFGKVLAHEMGHYLGLYHTFEGGCTDFNCLVDGDRVCDTPPDNSVRPSFACNAPQNTCNTDTLSNYSNGAFTTNVPDQIANFMDYGNGACSNQFTQGQADRMRAAVLTQRAGLLQDECTRPCIENIIAGFTRNNAYPIINDVIVFTNTTTGASQFEWSVDGTVVSSATDLSYSFAAKGKYKVTLKAYNTAACFASFTDYILVTCGVTARFFPNKKTIASMANVYTDSVLFTNTSVNGLTFQWLVSNSMGMPEQVVSTDSNLTYTFAQPATYNIRLVATNGACADTTDLDAISVANPIADGYPITMSVTCYQTNKVRVRFCLGNSGYAPIPQGTPVSFYDDNPYLSTANLLSPIDYLSYEVPGNCDECYTHILNVPYRGLEKIYLVFNDSGTTIPLQLPNTGFQESFYFNNTISFFAVRRTVSATICSGQSYAGHTATGTYIDTLASVINGCDSIRTLFLTVLPSPQRNIYRSICQGSDFEGYTATGTYTDVFTAANGCDSTRILHLTVKPNVVSVISATICSGQNYEGYTTTGLHIDNFTAANGCDSTRRLYLTVKPTSSSTIDTVICQGENYAGYTTTGTYTDIFPAANGCDSTRTLNLIVKPTVARNIFVVLCEGEQYAGYSTTGTYVDVFTSANGCDSTRTLYLTVKPDTSTTVTTSICDGEQYAGHTTTGTFVDVYNAANGCDSTRTLYLTVKPKPTRTINAVICQGQNVAGYTSTGTYIDVFTAANGCDSTRTLNLIVNPTKLTLVNVSRCRGESYFAAGQWQTETGLYIDTAQTYLGCDSIIKTRLTINPLPTPELGDDKRICFGDLLILDPGNFNHYLWQNGDTTRRFRTNQIGSYSVTVTNQFGCKAADTTDLVEIFPLPLNFLPKDSTLCRGNVLQIKVPGFETYRWSTGSLGNTINISQSNLYILNVKDTNNCKGADSINVLFKNCINLQMPNAFTPNADRTNDVFKPYVPAPVTDFQMRIWNKWGELLFESYDYRKGWNGTYKGIAQPMDTYVYMVTFKDVDGIKVSKKGTFILIR